MPDFFVPGKFRQAEKSVAHFRVSLKSRLNMYSEYSLAKTLD